jgi:hypothetical protein
MIALAVGLWCLFEGKIKTFQNKGILAFVAYAFLCMQLAPIIPLFINNNDASMFWMWKPVLIIFIYSFLIISVANIEFTKSDVVHILNIIAVCGAVMGAYIFLQEIGVDQFFIQKPGQSISAVTNPKLVGVLGQPTLVGSFLAITLPIAFCANKKICVLLIAIALFIINSKVALVSGFLGVLAYSILNKRGYVITGLMLIAVLFRLISIDIFPKTKTISHGPLSSSEIIKINQDEWHDSG